MRYLTRTSGPGASYALGEGFTELWSGGPAEPAPQSNLLGSIFNVFKDAGTAVTGAVTGAGQSVSAWQQAAPEAQPSFLSKLGSTLLNVGRNVNTSLTQQQQQQVAIAQGTQMSSYLPYLLLGGAAVAAVMIYKKRKKK